MRFKEGYMKPSSRMLIGFGSTIAVLVIFTIVLVLVLGQSSSPALPESTPQGAVQRYLQAVQDKDYAKAYSYLAPPSTPTPDGIKPYPQQTFEYFVMSAQNTTNVTWKANLGKVTQTGTSANVEIAVDVFRPQGPFGSPINSHNVTFFLQKSGANWLITAPTDLYWIY
jgi:hypothetical protein